ncbi:syntaxin-61 [Elaeis guineensis]|uniref:Syntaxin-61 n=1 Tax=Elaeis guineensis var. tenera TaxID=51953 RepID=A0A6I9S8H5_ELAGV|nr:syntaxin-61 [Elaeis guineensis]
MTSAQDPFYIVKDEIQESIDKLHDSFHRWEETPANSGDHLLLTKQLLANCESIKWQVDELDKAIAVAARDPAWYGLNEVELEKRRRWTNIAHKQVDSVRKAVEDGRKKSNSVNLGPSGMHRELMRLPIDHASQAGRSNNYAAEDNDDFISAESDRQMLLIKQQDQELDDLSISVQRIGDVGLTINEELIGQERILDDVSMEVETTSNRLGFVQKKVAMVMKKAGAKGQIMMILFLIVLFIVLFVLVFFT